MFPPALTGRLVAIPHVSFSPAMPECIAGLQLGRIVRRMARNQGMAPRYDPSVVEHIVSLRDDPDSGAG